MVFQKKITHGQYNDGFSQKSKNWWKNWGWIKQLIGQEFRLSSPIQKKKKAVKHYILSNNKIWNDMTYRYPNTHAVVAFVAVCEWVCDCPALSLWGLLFIYLFIFIYIKFLKPKPNNPTRFLSFYSFSFLVQSCAHGNRHKPFLLPALAHHWLVQLGPPPLFIALF